MEESAGHNWCAWSWRASPSASSPTRPHIKHDHIDRCIRLLVVCTSCILHCARNSIISFCSSAGPKSNEKRCCGILPISAVVGGNAKAASYAASSSFSSGSSLYAGKSCWGGSVGFEGSVAAVAHSIRQKRRLWNHFGNQ